MGRGGTACKGSTPRTGKCMPKQESLYCSNTKAMERYTGSEQINALKCNSEVPTFLSGHLFLGYLENNKYLQGVQYVYTHVGNTNPSMLLLCLF